MNQLTTTQVDRQVTWLWALYLLNLLLLPLFAAVVALAILFHTPPGKQSKRVIGAFAICLVALLILPALFWISLPKTGVFWAFFICYWVTAHASCILLGVFGLVRRTE
jgi:dolichol kinase